MIHTLGKGAHPTGLGVRPSRNCLVCSAAHLNAPYREWITPDDIAQALLSGTLEGLPEWKQFRVAALFGEVPPEMVAGCMAESGASPAATASLYAESVRIAGPVPEWEQASDVLAWV